jgi:hypothetical protein
MPVIPVTVGSTNKRICDQRAPGKKQDSIVNTTTEKKTGNVAQTVELLLPRCKAKNSNLTTFTKKV